MERARKAEDTKIKLAARTRAANILQAAEEAPVDHPYLTRKSVKPHGLYVGRDGRLVVPARDADGILHALQYIDPDGGKLFMKGGSKEGCFYLIGEPNGALYIAEGFATAATIHETTGVAVVVAFDSVNLSHVAKALRNKYPDLLISLCADDDIHLDNNTGLKSARKAAAAIGAALIVPDFGAGRPEKDASDFNELRRHLGPDVVAEQLNQPKKEDVDPLEGLVEKTALDPGAPFTPEVLERLVAFKKADRPAFEMLRSKLKKAGCRVTALDNAIYEESGEEARKTQANILIELAEDADLFHAADGTCFADVNIKEHRETWRIGSKGFKRWIARRFYEETGGAPNSEAVQSALNVIESKAHFDAGERQVHIRIGGKDRNIYLDLGDDTWRAVEIDANGWRVIDDPPVRLRRASGMRPLNASSWRIARETAAAISQCAV